MTHNLTNNDAVINEQISYYRARAAEYDRTVLGPDASAEAQADHFQGDLGTARDLLQQQGPFQSTLELACGTGIWTGVLASISEQVTAVDASPEMLEIVRGKMGDRDVAYKQADLFNWQPEHSYDLVFFAFFLSHVPPERLDSFLAAAASAVNSGGSVIIIDQYAPTQADNQVASGDIYAERPLQDGRTFTIIKVFYDIEVLHTSLANLGFEVEARALGNTFFFLTARRSTQEG